MRPAIFLDRDGVLCVNRDYYVKTKDELRLFPWTPLAINILSKLDLYIFVFTNQSVVGRGIIREKTANSINIELKRRAEGQNGRIDAIFMCPHAPEDYCDCRKPKPGMLFQAFDQFPDIDKDNITIVGDKLSDLVDVPGHQPNYFLVQSGTTKKLPRELWNKVPFVPSILEVAKEMKKWHSVPNLNIIAKNVASI